MYLLLEVAGERPEILRLNQLSNIISSDVSISHTDLIVRP